MANENAVQEEQEFINNDSLESFDLDELEATLQGQLEEELSDLAFLQEEQKQIGSPDALGETIKNVVWEQFINQIATTAGEDFIKENNGLHLDLRKEAHIQTVDNFEQQNYAKHNTYVDYEKRGEEYRSNFYTDPNVKPNAKQKQPQRFNEQTKVWETYDPVDGEWKKQLKDDYRTPYEKDRQQDRKNKFGNKTVNKDHQVADATIARDAKAGAYMTTEEKVQMANSEDNLYDLDSAANQSKSDHDGEKWVKHKRTGAKGKDQTNGEYFGIDEDEYIEQDKQAKEKVAEKLDEKEAENIALGKKSQRDEAFRIGGKALRAVVMQLLAELMKEIISKLVKWLKSATKKLETLLSALKEAITSFVGKLKTHLMNAADTALTTIATAIFGPVISTVKKVWAFLKQGWKSLMDAVAYIRNPENKGKPVGILLLEVGKIATACLTAAGAIVLGEVIEKALIAIPGVGAVFAFEIPLLGSLANLLGIFLGGVVAGIIGAIVINLLQKQIDKSKKSNLAEETIKKGNEILNLQHQAQIVGEALLERDKDDVQCNISGRHQAASAIMRDAYGNIMEDFVVDFSNIVNTPSMDEEDLAINREIDKANSDLDDLLSGWN